MRNIFDNSRNPQKECFTGSPVAIKRKEIISRALAVLPSLAHAAVWRGPGYDGWDYTTIVMMSPQGQPVARPPIEQTLKLGLGQGELISAMRLLLVY
jgi:hypothetical protein